MKTLKSFLYNFSLITLIILTIDFIYTKKYFLKYFDISIKEKDYSNIYEKNNLNRIVFKNNINEDVEYNKFKYKVCTNDYGFRDFCTNQNNSKELGIVFSGDSNLFGYGLNIEDIFFGIIKTKLNKITNISEGDSGVRDSFEKVKYLVNNDFKIHKLIYYFDISDIQDEARYLNDIHKKNKIILNEDNQFKNEKIYNFKFLKELLKRNFSLTHNFLINVRYFYLPKPVYRYQENYYRSSWTYNSNSGDYEPLGVNRTINSFLVILEDFYNFTNNNNIELVLLISPWPNQIMYDSKNSRHVSIAQDFCKLRCDLINLYPDHFDYLEKFSKKNTIKKLYLEGDMHSSKLGHEIIAKKIITYLNEKN